ncbi:hypothetical protein NC652_023335 [Populus alba x Populus x berolinensis]|nr:hypothetical protein NC652_023335 [Populus alba x Populus x berolinensis]
MAHHADGSCQSNSETGRLVLKLIIDKIKDNKWSVQHSSHEGLWYVRNAVDPEKRKEAPSSFSLL